jgi:hypothetical protein
MNERIKDMLEQPVFDRLRDWYNIGPVQRATLEDFAGLVAAEVINKAEDYGLGTDAVEHLKEYFEVE